MRKFEVYKRGVKQDIMNNQFIYSRKYCDELYEYRLVTTNPDVAKEIIEKGLMAEERWRELGIRMSKGWVNYTIYKLDPSILVFRRPCGTDGTTGLVDIRLKNQMLIELSNGRRRIPTKFA